MIETGRYVDQELQAGVDLCRAGQWDRGVSLLVRLAEERSELPPVACSYLGYGLAQDRRRLREGVELCRHAAKQEFYQPEIMHNLARAELAAGHRMEAVRALEAGLKLDPDHRGLNELRREMGLRRSPILPFLARDNPLNILLGRIRHAIKG